MGPIERRLDALETLSGIHEPEFIREYSDPATGDTTRVYLQTGRSSASRRSSAMAGHLPLLRLLVDRRQGWQVSRSVVLSAYPLKEVLEEYCIIASFRELVALAPEPPRADTNDAALERERRRCLDDDPKQLKPRQ